MEGTKVDFVKYIQIQDEGEAKAIFANNGCRVDSWATDGDGTLYIHQRSVGPYGRPSILVGLPDRQIPLLKDGMPQTTEDLSPETLVDACLGFRIPEITQRVCPRFSMDARVAFCRSIWSVSRWVVHTHLTYDVHEAEYMLVMDKRVGQSYLAGDMHEFRDVSAGSVARWWGKPLRAGKAEGNKTYRNFFLLPIGFCHDRQNVDINIRKTYISMAEAYFAGEPYIDAEFMKGGVVSQKDV